ncbi:septum formation initiator family protein [Faecalimonas sp.]
MTKINKKISARQRKQQLKRHKRSMIVVTCVLALLGVVVFVGSVSLRSQNRTYKAQEKELQREIREEEERLEDIKELEEYVQTDEYIEDKAKEELGLARKNEILFQTEK